MTAPATRWGTPAVNGAGRARGCRRDGVGSPAATVLAVEARSGTDGGPGGGGATVGVSAAAGTTDPGTTGARDGAPGSPGPASVVVGTISPLRRRAGSVGAAEADRPTEWTWVVAAGAAGRAIRQPGRRRLGSRNWRPSGWGRPWFKSQSSRHRRGSPRWRSARRQRESPGRTRCTASATARASSRAGAGRQAPAGTGSVDDAASADSRDVAMVELGAGGGTTAGAVIGATAPACTGSATAGARRGPRTPTSVTAAVAKR